MRDKSGVWIVFVDMLLAILAVVIVAVNPPSAKQEGVPTKAEYLITIEWPVDIDADADIHLMTPSGKPVFYMSRDVGCAKLDQDSRGFLDNQIKLDDGTTVKVESDKETITLRCIQPGHYDAAANLYGYRKDGNSLRGQKGLELRVHVEIVQLNPAYHIVFEKDIILDYVGETINWASFDLSKDGTLTLTEPPIEPITKAYQK